MPAEFLTQEEIDDLTAQIKGRDDVIEDTQQVEGSNKQVRSYNIAQQERIVRGRMPTLEVINERMARHLRISLFNFMRRNPEISVENVKVAKYSEFIRDLVVPTNLNVVSFKGLRGNGLFIFEPNLIYGIVDHLFGGDGKFQAQNDGREFSETENKIVKQMLGLVFKEYQSVWAPVHKLEVVLMRSEMHTQFANIANPSELVVSSSFKIEIGNTSGYLHICIPYSTIEPIRDLLSSTVQGDQAEPDRRWVDMLTNQVQEAKVDLVATLCRARMKIKQLLELEVGDVISVEIDDLIEASVNGVPLFKCSYGTTNGKYAIEIEKTLDKNKSTAFGMAGMHSKSASLKEEITESR